MLVLHANWSDGALHVWAESLEAHTRAEQDTAGGATAVAVESATHPFAAAPAEVTAAVLEAVAGRAVVEADERAVVLRLPAVDGMPLASDRLRGLFVDDSDQPEPTLTDFRVPTAALRLDRALAILIALDEFDPDTAPPEAASLGIELGHSLRYWTEVGRLVHDLLVQQRFVPTLIRSRETDLQAAWQPWLHEPSVAARLGGLLAGMPPVVRGVDDAHGGRPWPILDDALRTLTDAAVRQALMEEDFADAVEGRDPGADPHVAWLSGLLDGRSGVEPPPDRGTELLRDVGRWIGGLEDGPQDRTLRLCLRLREPDDADLGDGAAPAAQWPLTLHLLGGAGGNTLIDAEDIWRDPATVQPAAGGGRNPEETLLAELGRAARIYPPLEQALTDAQPTGIELTTAEASEFLREHKDVLEEAGVSVIVPDWWGRPSARLGARLQLETPELQGNGAGGRTATHHLLGLGSIVRYKWQIAVGEDPISLDEFRELAKTAGDGTLVRVHGRWVELNAEQVKSAAAFLDETPGGEMTLLEAVQLAHGAAAGQLGLPILGMDASGWVSDLLGASSGEGKMPTLVPPDLFKGTLRPYQLAGLSWLSFLDRFGLGACLADDMGLGKTIQLIALLQHERAVAQADAADAAPVGTDAARRADLGDRATGSRELERFAPEIRVPHPPWSGAARPATRSSRSRATTWTSS